MKKLLLLTFLFISFLCEAQQKTFITDWKKSYGGNNIDRAYDIKKTTDGGYIVSGITGTPNNGDVSGWHGASDVWILKLDPNGNKQWAKCYGGSYTESGPTGGNFPGNQTNPINIQLTPDGGYIFATNSFSNNGDVTNHSNSFDFSDCWIVKLNSSGVIEWQKSIGYSYNEYATSIVSTLDGGYIFAGYFDNGPVTPRDIMLVKITNSGNIVWRKNYGGSKDETYPQIIKTHDNAFVIACNTTSNDGDVGSTHLDSVSWSRNIWLFKINDTGRIVWQEVYSGSKDDQVYSISETNDNGFILSGTSESNNDDFNGNRGYNDYIIIKSNSIGKKEWQRSFGGSKYDYGKSIIQTYDSGYLVTGYINSIDGDIIGNSDISPLNPNSGWIIKLNSNGYLQSQKTISEPQGVYTYSTVQDSENQFVVAGSSGVVENIYIIKLLLVNADSINGKVFQSQNSNCSQEPNEKGIQNVIVNTEPKNFFGISDTVGKYSILTDTGTYKVKQIIPQILKPFLQQTVCPTQGNHTVSFSQYGQDTSEINFANYEKQCAYLQLELAQGRMRRCFDNNTTIKYCNIGNVDTTNVQVIVTLPEYVTFVSASNPNYTISGKKITFNIGTLRANECGTINLITNVDCVEGIVGLTQCISAYILPRNKCVDQIQPDYALWDKSEVSVDGRCTGNTARFVIKNIGQNNMTDSSLYRIYKDAVEAVSRRFKLIAGDSLVINVTALGFTYRLEADQVPHFPSASAPSITIENCGTGAASRLFVNQMPQDFAAPHQEKICLPIRDSYDPNDKSVSPSGVGANKLVKHKVPLDYLIRFQNTGTDTAYTVVIIDTLDQNLDLATLEFGASSHKYKIEFTGSGKPILKFTFDKINLVDSFTNEPKSHGFVSFKITPYDSIPNGTLVKNSADIYFDFNLPIKTNTTQVSIDDRLPTGATLSFVTTLKEQKNNYEAIYVYPNPFNTITNFEFVYNTKATQLIVYNINGELVANENVANQTRYQFQRNNLSNGMYFYVVQNKEGETIGRGKIVLQ